MTCGSPTIQGKLSVPWDDEPIPHFGDIMLHQHYIFEEVVFRALAALRLHPPYSFPLVFFKIYNNSSHLADPESGIVDKHVVGCVGLAFVDLRPGCGCRSGCCIGFDRGNKGKSTL